MNTVEIIKIKGAARYQYSINGELHYYVYDTRGKAMAAARVKILRKIMKQKKIIK